LILFFFIFENSFLSFSKLFGPPHIMDIFSIITPFSVFSTDFAFDELHIDADEEWKKLSREQLERYRQIAEEVKKIYMETHPARSRNLCTGFRVLTSSARSCAASMSRRVIERSRSRSPPALIRHQAFLTPPATPGVAPVNTTKTWISNFKSIIFLILSKEKMILAGNIFCECHLFEPSRTVKERIL